MSTEVKVPPLPESVTEATVAVWHKQPGDAVSRDENLVDLETDKVVLEVPSPITGVLSEVLAAEGDTVEAGQLLARLEAGETVQAAAPAKAAPAQSEATAAAATNIEDLSPAVRRLVAEHSLDPNKIQGTGRDGRITKEDVLNFMDAGESSAGESVRERPAAAQAAAASPEPAVQLQTAPAGERTERRVPMTRLRQRIAERLVEAQQNAAMLTTFNEVNMKQMMDLRSKYRDLFEKTHDTRLGFMSFFVKASIEALKRFPAVHGAIHANDIIYHDYFDIGIAVSSPRALALPIP